jgi:hypothetical protein
VYPFGPVGSPIELYSGPISVDSADPLLDASLWISLVIFRCAGNVTGVVRPFQPGHASLELSYQTSGRSPCPHSSTAGVERA